MANQTNNSRKSQNKRKEKPGDNDIVVVLQQAVNLSESLVEDFAGAFLFPTARNKQSRAKSADLKKSSLQVESFFARS